MNMVWLVEKEQLKKIPGNNQNIYQPYDHHAYLLVIPRALKIYKYCLRI